MSRMSKGERSAPAERRAVDNAKAKGERTRDPRRTVERIQTGVRMERRILGVLKALADLHGISLGDLLEGIVLHVFEGRSPFSPESLVKIRSLKDVFGLDLDAADSHLLVEPKKSPSAPKSPARGGKSS